jgi:uncharacterized glyoxalase superfamily protein PhnB
MSNVDANLRERALLCYRVLFGAAPTRVTEVRELLVHAIRWRRLADAMSDRALQAEMRAIGESYLALAERVQLERADEMEETPAAVALG